MATVTGYTAARMKTIEDTAVVDGIVSGDELILIRHNGTTIDAGSVRGPQGIQGPGGGDLAPVMELLCPVGTMVPFGGVAEPTGWLICDGRSLLRSDYQDLYDSILTTHGAGTPADGNHFNIPDMRQRVPMGKAAAGTGSILGAKGGSKDLIIPSHSHDHYHTIPDDGAHGHTIAGDSGERIIVTVGGTQNQYLPASGALGVAPSHVDAAGNHDHGGTVSWDRSVVGQSPTDGNLPPYTVINYIIRY